jgi:Ran GTPase-activating protein (RanGAP) involved in mRNA processing and transport
MYSLMMSFLLSADGKRELVDVTRANELVSPLLDTSQHFSKLVLTGKSFSPEAAQVFGQAIRNLPKTLLEVDFSDVIAGRQTEEANQVLAILCSSLVDHPVKSINLSDNAIGVSGVSAVVPALRKVTLERVYFNNNGMEADPVSSIVSALIEAHEEKQTNLTHFEIFCNMIDSTGAQALVPLLQHSPKLRHFRMASTRVKEKGGKAIAKAISATKSLEYLNLNDNSLGTEAALMLAHWIQSGSASNLNYLNIGDISAEAGGIRQILHALSSVQSPLLSVLELNSSDITPGIAPLLAQTLNRQTKLERLNLDGNRMHTAGIKLLVDPIKAVASLRCLNLIDNGMNKSGKKEITEQLSSLQELKLLVREEDEDEEDEDDEEEEEEEEESVNNKELEEIMKQIAETKL